MSGLSLIDNTSGHDRASGSLQNHFYFDRSRSSHCLKKRDCPVGVSVRWWSHLISNYSSMKRLKDSCYWNWTVWPIDAEGIDLLLFTSSLQMPLFRLIFQMFAALFTSVFGNTFFNNGRYSKRDWKWSLGAEYNTHQLSLEHRQYLIHDPISDDVKRVDIKSANKFPLRFLSWKGWGLDTSCHLVIKMLMQVSKRRRLRVIR